MGTNIKSYEIKKLNSSSLKILQCLRSKDIQKYMDLVSKIDIVRTGLNIFLLMVSNCKNSLVFRQDRQLFMA